MFRQSHTCNTLNSNGNSYPFGMQMPGRATGLGDYRYAYNGMETDAEVTGDYGNSYTTVFRQYDPRLMRWKSLDPAIKSFPHQSPYVGMDNNPILHNDPFGDSVRYEKFRDRVNVFFKKMGNKDFREDHKSRKSSESTYTYRKSAGEPELENARERTDLSLPTSIDGGSMRRQGSVDYVSVLYANQGSGGGGGPFPTIEIEWGTKNISILNTSRRSEPDDREKNTTTLFSSRVRLHRRVDGSLILLEPKDYPDKFDLKQNGNEILSLTLSEAHRSGREYVGVQTISGPYSVPGATGINGPLTIKITSQTPKWPLIGGGNGTEDDSFSKITWIRWRGYNISINLPIKYPTKISIKW
jgi:RHS repeat-associated protein